MSSFFLFAKKNGFFKNTVILSLGTIIAQIIPLLFYPVLARLYSPADFGIFASIIALTAILRVIASGKYEFAILIAPTKQTAADLVFLIILLSFVFLSTSLIILLVFSDTISSLFNEPELQRWLFISPISAFLIIIFGVYNEWCVRNEDFKKLSINKITNGGATSLSKTIFGYVKVLSGGLVIGDFIGRLITAVLCVVKALKNDKEILLNQSKKRIIEVAKRYIDIPKFILPGQILNVVNAQLSTFLILIFFSSSELGYYSMALMVLVLPSLVISNSVKDVFRKEANDVYSKEGNCILVYRKTLTILAGISFFSFTILYFIVPTLFEVVLGQNWSLAGKYAQILIPMVAINFVTEVGASLFIIAEKMKEALWWQIGYFSTTIVSLLIGFYCFGDIESVLLCLVIGGSIAHLCNFLLSRKFAMGK